MHIKSFVYFVVLLFSAVTVFAQSALTWGTSASVERDAHWLITGGAILSIKGTVDETFRLLYDVQGTPDKQSRAESYSLSDFSVSGPYPSFGLQAEKAWRFVTFRWSLDLVNVAEDAVARRNYYIGVGKTIPYGGREYDHLMITEGNSFSMDFFGGFSELLWSITPFTLWFDEQVSLTPSLDLGLSLIGGSYTIDAGESIGTTVYQNPPVDFVIGGKSSGFVGVGAPTVGLGLSLRAGPSDGIQWVTDAHVGYFAYDGRTDFLTTADHRRKEADVQLYKLSVQSLVTIPINERNAFTLGLRGQFLNFRGTFSSSEKTPDRVLEARERFDKDVDLRMVNLWLLMGLTF